MTTWAIIPVKPLRYGKSRLSHILTPDERAQLTTKMLRRTLKVLEEVAGIYRTLVISRDPAALKIGREYGAYTYGEGEKQDLNVALTRAAHIAAAQEASGVLVIPADLPLITVADVEMMLAGVAPTMSYATARDYSNGTIRFRQPRAITICPDRNKNGTNALYVTPPLGFEFRYGDGSFERHLQEAEQLGMNSRIVHAPGLKFDLDTEEDWYTYQTLNGGEGRVGYKEAIL
jgi:2-phospho-L-lactate guanylyltransferase